MSGLRILVADDNRDCVEALGRLLRTLGHEVATVDQGDAVLEEAVRQGSQLLLLDIGMPGVSGYQVAAQLRSGLSTRYATIVALTGWTTEEIGGNTLRADAASFNRECKRLHSLAETMTNYQQAFLFQVSQSVACNGLHVIVERCCRWLLMTHDRVDGDELALTHEFLSFMLGVRRSGITELLQSLQQQGLIRYGKGKINILDRERLEEIACECYQAIQDEYQRLLG
jgi:CheY-like chemotaxis protein